MDTSFQANIRDYILSGHAYLSVPTPETPRFVAELKRLAVELPPSGRPVFIGSAATGWQDSDGNPAKTASGAELGPPNPQIAAQQILDLPEECLFVLKDFSPYLHARTFAAFDLVIAWLIEIRDVLAHTGRTVLFVGTDLEIPPALEHEITTIEFKLPDDGAIEKAVRFVGEDHPLDEKALPALVTACRGLTQQQVEDRVALALRKFKKLDQDAAGLILNEKAQVIRRTGLLDYRDPPEGGLDLLGGWENVKQHVQLDKPCFSPEARKSVSAECCSQSLKSAGMRSEQGPSVPCARPTLRLSPRSPHSRRLIGQQPGAGNCVLMEALLGSARGHPGD